MSILTRRSLLRGLFAAPAIVAASSLMPIRGEPLLIPRPGLVPLNPAPIVLSGLTGLPLGATCTIGWGQGDVVVTLPKDQFAIVWGEQSLHITRIAGQPVGDRPSFQHAFVGNFDTPRDILVS